MDELMTSASTVPDEIGDDADIRCRYLSSSPLYRIGRLNFTIRLSDQKLSRRYEPEHGLSALVETEALIALGIIAYGSPYHKAYAGFPNSFS